MSLRITLPDKGSLPFIVPDSAEAYIRDVLIAWRTPEEQLNCKIEQLDKDGNDIESPSIEDTIKAMLRKGITTGKVYLLKLKFKSEKLSPELKVKSVVNKNITFEALNAKNKVVLQKATEEEFLEILKKYNPK